MVDYPRPIVPVVLEDDKEHRRLLAIRANAAFPKDGSEGMQKPLPLLSRTVAQLTGDYAASLWTGSIIYVSDESGGATVAYSNGTNWKRVTDGATVS